MKKSTIVLTLIVFALKINWILADFKIFCYFTSWAQFRPTGAEFFPEDTDPFLCTHIIYAFGVITDDKTLAPSDERDIKIDGGPGIFERTMTLKEINPKLKILLAVGGWNAGSAQFEKVLGDAATFAANSIQFLRKWKFDGLDIDWEFPVIHKQEFTIFMKTIKDAFNSEPTNQEKLILTMATSAGQGTIDSSYEVAALGRIVDYNNLMTYDMHGSWEMKTGFHSGLYANSKEQGWERTLNSNWSVNYWISNGFPREKLVLGVPFYGRGWKLANPSDRSVGSPSASASKAGDYTKEQGILSYYEICKLKKNKNGEEIFNEEQLVPSLIADGEWIGFENQRSVEIKGKYIVDNCLAGAMIWTLDFDDFRGTFCGQSNYPLLSTLFVTLEGNTCKNGGEITTSSSTKLPSVSITSSVSTVSSSSTASSIVTSSVGPTSSFIPPTSCTKTGVIAVPNDCSSFQVCLSGFVLPVATVKCPNSNWFNPQLETCVSQKPSSCGGNDGTDQVIIIKNTFSCPSAFGTFPIKENCNSYWECSNFRSFLKSCPPTLVFNSQSGICDYTSPSCPKFGPKYSRTIQKLMEGYKFECDSDGLFPNRADKHSFYVCSNKRSFKAQCPDQLVFSSLKKSCDYES